MGFYEQLRGLMCQNRGLLNAREQSNTGGNIRQGQLIYFFIVLFHKETEAMKEFIFPAWVRIVPVFLIAHRDIPSAQLMAPLHSNLVQYSPHQAEEARAVSDIDFTFTKHFQDGLLASSSSLLLSASITSWSRSSDVHRSNRVNLPIVSRAIAFCSVHVSSAGDGSSYNLSPVFRNSDTLLLFSRSYRILTS